MRDNLSSRFCVLLFCLGYCLFVGACSTHSSQSVVNNKVATDSRLELDNKEIIKSFYKALNDTNWQKLKTLVSDDYRHYYAKDTGFNSISWQSAERGFKGVRSAFADWRLTPIKMIAEGDYVSVLLIGGGTHTGSFAGIAATGKVVKAPAMTIHQLKDGKIIADWELLDNGAFLEQLKN
ncbi:MAG: hypothetical protein EOO10_07225 [Chitinophagaceae bacterium]|nr:MAG: hypothetical protein EOO10_07225 [Chitinophagaceae bacterium]